MTPQPHSNTVQPLSPKKLSYCHSNLFRSNFSDLPSDESLLPQPLPAEATPPQLGAMGQAFN